MESVRPLVAVESAQVFPPPDEPPTAHRPAGWDEAVLAIHSARSLDAQMLMLLEPDGSPPIYIDFERRLFYFHHPMDTLPSAPPFVNVQTQQLDAGESPFTFPGRPLDTLLWTIGQAAFDGSPAPWLKDNQSFGLHNWPNFTELTHTFDHLRVTARMGNLTFTSSQLAAATEASLESVQRMINAYSLMGLLRESVPDASVPASAAIASTSRLGTILHKLRIRWGR